MNKNYMKEVAELLDVKLEEEFYVVGEFDCFKFSDTGLFQYNSNLDRWVRTNGHVLGRLLQNELKIERYILNQKEQEYLRDVIKPFRDEISYISKHSCFEFEWLKIYMGKDNSMIFPNFKENTMYKNMEIDKEYTLEELGL